MENFSGFGKLNIRNNLMNFRIKRNLSIKISNIISVIYIEGNRPKKCGLFPKLERQR